MSEVKTFTEQRCTCGLLFQPLTWMAWRVRGYCCADCDPEEVAKKRAVILAKQHAEAEKLAAELAAQLDETSEMPF